MTVTIKNISIASESILQPIYVCRYDHETEANGQKKCKWLLTSEYHEAIHIDPKFKLATLHDLNEWVAATGVIFKGILNCISGKCEWFEHSYIDKYGMQEFSCGYQLI